MAWKLIARNDSILLFGNHLYLEILDDNGNRVWHIHGLGTDKYGNPVEIGNLTSTTDTIKVWTYKKNNSFEDNDGSHVLYSGTQLSIEKSLKDIFAAKNFINAQNFIYQATPGDTNDDNGFGGKKFNSNSVFNTLLNVFRKTLPIKDVDVAESKNLGAYLSKTPGKDLDILHELGWSRNGADPSGLGSVVKGTPLPDTIYAPDKGLHKIAGGAGDDALIGNELNDELKGDAGNDSIKGGGGYDKIYGGDGNNEIGGNYNFMIDNNKTRFVMLA